MLPHLCMSFGTALLQFSRDAQHQSSGVVTAIQLGEQPWCNDVNRVPAVSGAKSHRCGNTNKQGCFLVASTEQHWCSEREQGPALWCCASLLNCSRAVRGAKLIGVTAPTSKAVSSCFTEQHWCSEREQGPRLWCCASLLNCSRAVLQVPNL